MNVVFDKVVRNTGGKAVTLVTAAALVTAVPLSLTLLGVASHPQNITSISPFLQNGAKSGFEMCFDIGSQHPWVLGPKHVSNPE